MSRHWDVSAATGFADPLFPVDDVPGSLAAASMGRNSFTLDENAASLAEMDQLWASARPLPEWSSAGQQCDMFASAATPDEAAFLAAPGQTGTSALDTFGCEAGFAGLSQLQQEQLLQQQALLAEQEAGVRRHRSLPATFHTEADYRDVEAWLRSNATALNGLPQQQTLPSTSPQVLDSPHTTMSCVTPLGLLLEGLARKSVTLAEALGMRRGVAPPTATRTGLASPTAGTHTSLEAALAALSLPNDGKACSSSGTNTPTGGPGGRGQGPVHNALYKTELCRAWEETGTCRYGAKCQFAHGLPELRQVARHPKYKTQTCRTFATTGTCPYGKRCKFIHYSKTLDAAAAALPSSPVSPLVHLPSDESASNSDNSDLLCASADSSFTSGGSLPGSVAGLGGTHKGFPVRRAISERFSRASLDSGRRLPVFVGLADRPQGAIAEEPSGILFSSVGGQASAPAAPTRSFANIGVGAGSGGKYLVPGSM